MQTIPAYEIAELAINAISNIRNDHNQFTSSDDYLCYQNNYSAPNICLNMSNDEIIKILVTERYRAFSELYFGYTHNGINPLADRTWAIIKIYDMALSDIQKYSI